MPKIATPISTLFEKSARRNEILALSDAIELRDHSVNVQTDLPRLFHCEASIIEPWDVEEAARISNFIKDNDVVLVTFHLNSCFIKPPIRDNVFQPEGQRMTKEEMFENARSNRSKLPPDLQIALENNNYYPTPAYDIVTDPEFINEAARKLNAGLLLDMGHTIVTAGNREIPHQQYLEKFDFANVIQIHLSRSGYSSIWHDAHEALEDEDWQLAAGIIKRCPNLQYVTIEYYKDDEKLIAMLKKLREMK